MPTWERPHLQLYKMEMPTVVHHFHYMRFSMNLSFLNNSAEIVADMHMTNILQH